MKAQITPTTTIEISIATRDKLYSLGQEIAKIARKRSLSFDQTINILLSAKTLDQQISELILQ